jgi:RNA polymerase sigma factor (sigma-70 family)
MKWVRNSADEVDPDVADVRALQGGEDEALGRIMGRYKEQIYRFLLHTMHYNRFLAEDLTQEVFIRCYNSISQFNGRGSFRHWLFRLTHNLLKDAVKSRGHKESLRTDSLDRPLDDEEGNTLLTFSLAAEGTPASAMQNRELLEALKQAIEELPLELKTAFVLAVLEQYSHVEAGERIGISPKAVEMRVYKARKLLEEKMRSFLEG